MNHFENNEYAKEWLAERYDEEPLKIMEKVADKTISYYFGNDDEYQIEVDGNQFFNKYEVQHMRDVKDLYVIGQIIAVISFFTFIACFFYIARWFRRMRKKIVIYTACFYGGLLVLVGIFLLISYVNYKNDEFGNSYFVHMFINFHHLIFWDNDKFMLAISSGKYGGVLKTLTTILDTQLFMDAGIIIAIVTLSIILLWIVTIIVFYKLHPAIARKVDDIHERARNSQNVLN